MDGGHRDAVPIPTTLLFGMASGLTSSALLQPLDRLKTLSQQLENQGRSVPNLFVGVLREAGWLSLWRGLAPTVVRVVPGVALHFTLVETLKPHIIPKGRREDSGTKLANRFFLLGFISRCIVAAVMQPATLLKTRFESSLAGSHQPIKQLVRSEGLRYLWRGLTPTLLRDAPFSGLYLMFYRSQLHALAISEGENAPVARALCGTMAGIAACLLTHPFDAVKTAVQLYPEKFRGSTANAVAKLYLAGGIPAFFRGFLIRATKRSLSSGLSWVLFDEVSWTAVELLVCFRAEEATYETSHDE